MKSKTKTDKPKTRIEDMLKIGAGAQYGNSEDFLKTVRRGPSNKPSKRMCDTDYNYAVHELMSSVVTDALTNGGNYGALFCIADALAWPREWSCESEHSDISPGIEHEVVQKPFSEMTPKERAEAVETYLGKGFRANNRHKKYLYTRRHYQSP